MKKRKLLFTLLALSLGWLFGGSGAMAQNGWDAIYSQTQTTSKSWTKLSESSTTGKVLGSSGATTYYYVTESLDFTNDRTDNDGDGNSGLKIQGTVYLYIPSGLHIFCRGANADGRTGAGAGIELTEGNTLYIIGGGNGAYVEAKGGNAEKGRDGGTGTDATGNSDDLWTGTGGKGGNGGGGAGAGIGSRGGNGGTGGDGGKGYKRGWTAYSGTNGSSGTNGKTAGAMGKLYVDQTNGIKVTATRGNAGTSGGNGGQRGRGYAWDGSGNNYTVAGGGGGGGGGYGGAAANIGTGGPGGGGGGGGAGGAVDWRPNSKGGVNDVTAPGGHGGKNADGSSAGEGVEAATTGTAHSQGWVTVDNGSFNTTSDWNPASGDCSFGSGGDGGGNGNAASNGTTNEGRLEYNITYHPIKTKVDGETTNPVTVKYAPSSNTNLVLPQNKDGYQWALLVYGKDCHASGSTSPFATDNKVFYGGSEDDDADRTILLKDVYGDLEFQEVAAFCKLGNMGDNSQLLNEFFFDESVKSNKYPITVRLKDRTLYKDKRWNTICLPFDLTPAQFAASPLAGATVMKMDSNNTGYYSDGVQIPSAHIMTNDPILVLWFENAEPSTNGLQKGKPYLVRWNSGDNLVDNTKEKIHQLDFNNVTITEKVAGNWYSNDVTFQGTFSQSADLKANDITNLILGPENKLYYPSTDINVGSCRGYFILPPDVADAAQTRGIVMGFEGEGTTDIQSIKFNREDQNGAPVYSLTGQCLSAPRKGINIINGKKVVIK